MVREGNSLIGMINMHKNESKSVVNDCTGQDHSMIWMLLVGDTGLKIFTFPSNSKEWQCRRMFKLLHRCALFTFQQDDAQNPSSQATIVCELITSRYTSLIQKRQKNHRLNWQHLLDPRKKQENYRKYIYFCIIDYAEAIACMDQNKQENS